MNVDNQRPREEAMEKIENFIIEKNLNEYDRLPSERIMCEMWGYNRITLRSAIKQLISEGKLYSKMGSGTFVAAKKLIRNLQNVEGFYETVKKAGRKIETKVVNLSFSEVTKSIGQKMKLPLGHKILVLIRVRYLDSIPVLYETTYINAIRFEGLEKYNFAKDSLYNILKKDYNVEILEGCEKLSIAYSDEQESRYLNIKEGTSVIYQTGITIDNEEKILEYFKSVTRAEYVSFGSNLTRR
ncbi:MAG: GntR family transcriptional regulator [Lactovum sp.]